MNPHWGCQGARACKVVWAITLTLRDSAPRSITESNAPLRPHLLSNLIPPTRTAPLLSLPRSIRIRIQAPPTRMGQALPAHSHGTLHNVSFPHYLLLMLLVLPTRQCRLKLHPRRPEIRLNGFNLRVPFLPSRREPFALRCLGWER